MIALRDPEILRIWARVQYELAHQRLIVARLAEPPAVEANRFICRVRDNVRKMEKAND